MQIAGQTPTVEMVAARGAGARSARVEETPEEPAPKISREEELKAEGSRLLASGDLAGCVCPRIAAGNPGLGFAPWRTGIPLRIALGSMRLPSAHSPD